MKLPWLHPHRADVLAAIALAVRRREPLPEGLARLAEHDPLLQPWSRRLGPPLAAGEALPAVLQRHRLIDDATAAAMACSGDAVAAIDRAASDSLAAPRGLLLITWFPVALVVALLIPLAVLQASGVLGVFEQMFRDLNIRLPALTVMMIEHRLDGVYIPLVGGAAMWCVLGVLRQMTGVRHLAHLWWVEVHRQAALLALVDAAIACDDEPVHLDPPFDLVAGLYYQFQDRPPWHPHWRTWWCLTRWRAGGPQWRAARGAGTAADLLHALGLLPHGVGLADLRDAVRTRLILALEPAVVEARALLMVGVAIGAFLGVIAMFLPLVWMPVGLNAGGG
jgi:hypothetical protein